MPRTKQPKIVPKVINCYKGGEVITCPMSEVKGPEVDKAMERFAEIMWEVAKKRVLLESNLNDAG